MDGRKPFQATAEQLALAQARKEKKRKQALEAAALQETAQSTLLNRPWLNISHSPSTGSKTKVLTWNILAQCLVRRTLFPTSDCLKSAQRESLISEEIRRQNAQIICLQEVDQPEKVLPMLENAGYAHHYASGPRKKHGCLIGYKRELYSIVAENIVFYDDQHVGAVYDKNRVGASFKTKNIGYMVAIKSKADENEGLIVATTHLFWHPKYTYERIRQAAILIREVMAFQETLSVAAWPCVIAGDFNFGPSDAGYSLLTGDVLLPSQKEDIILSMVVHSSIDPTVLKDTRPPQAKEDEEGNAVDADRAITSARAANDSDGLLSIKEIVDWFSLLPNVRSVYEDGLHEARQLGHNIPKYGDRTAVPGGRHGAHEPEYTSYTHYWQAVLDYIFIIETPKRPVSISGLLAPLSAKDMAPGLPQKRVSGSDHTCLVAEVTW